MKVDNTNVVTPVNILFNDHFAAKNITIDFEKITTKADNGLKVIKAGTPVSKEGTIAKITESKTDAVGILLHDCYEDNPNTALIIHGFIDEEKAKSNSGVTIDDVTKEALPMIAFY